MSRLPDLVQDSKLETEFHAKYTTHIYHEATSQQGKPRREYWTRERCIATGGFGVVWRERCVRGHGDNEVRAVKQFPKPAKTKDYLRELEAVAKFSHPRYVRRFVKSLGWYEDEDDLYIAMEFMPEGDLFRHLAKGQRLPEIEAQQITFQLLEALSYMHENGFAHRDLKPRNILIQAKPPEEWCVKVADFGISKRAGEVHATHSTIKGTPAYMAPECQGLLESPEGEPTAADIWALGESVHNMLTLKPTFDGKLRARELTKYIEGRREFSDVCLQEVGASDAVIRFVRAAMAPDPGNRMTTQQALEHEWLSVFARTTSRPASILSLDVGHTDGTDRSDADDDFFPSLSEASGRWTTMQGTVDDESSARDSPTKALYAQQPPNSSESDQTATRHEEAERLEPIPSTSAPTKISSNAATDHVSGVAFSRVFTISPDGKWLAIVPHGDMVLVQIWEVLAGVLIRTLEPCRTLFPGSGKRKPSEFVLVTFSPVADILAVGFSGDSGRINIYNVNSGLLILTIQDPASQWIHGQLEFSQDGSQIAYRTGSSIAIARLGERLIVEYLEPRFPSRHGIVQAIKLGDRRLMVACGAGIGVWDTRSLSSEPHSFHNFKDRTLYFPQWSQDLTAMLYFTHNERDVYCGNLWKEGQGFWSRHRHIAWDPTIAIVDPEQAVIALSRGGERVAMTCSSDPLHTIELRDGSTGALVTKRDFDFEIRAMRFTINSRKQEVLVIAGNVKGNELFRVRVATES